ncbi:SDR family NAD(P)-dependent oxidoreductase [Nocardioides sp. AE5]|uniref:SDR family NAD(P)-dependent oxidoreductase n=1 Tax=Nocardioides sp. AE5 TaxID=2962573 RepID=UPI00288255E7|nr:SDR family NAD(P)-dependent oxidoreductase [Nocardioides sp. AE5]MDT0203238.1 SDR family oxidoreductase [Nocardioides sp. AE5]
MSEHPDQWPLPNVDQSLAGQVAIVTGATAGLGERFARVLAAAGAKVAVTGRRTERIAEVVEAITAEGGTAYGVRLDVADPASIEACVAEVSAELGTVQILVNNAGIPDAARAHKMSLELVDAVLDTNVRGPWLMSTEVARRLIAAELPGRIVNLSSINAFHYAGEGAALYATSKAAVSRMTETLAVEWARHRINVNAIAPGAFASEMMDGMISRIGDPSAAFPRKRLGHPAQLDSTLLYLVAPTSEFVTGTIVVVDDGQTHR